MQYALRKAPESLSIDLEGDFTFNDSDIFIQIVRAVSQGNQEAIRLNLENLKRIDSSALDMLLRFLDVSKQNHQELTIERPRGQVEQRLRNAARFNSSLVIVQ